MISKAQQKLIDTNKRLKINVGVAIFISCLCVSDQHALAMEEFVCNHPDETADVYIDKAYEIIGEPRTEYYVDGKE